MYDISSDFIVKLMFCKFLKHSFSCNWLHRWYWQGVCEAGEGCFSDYVIIELFKAKHY